jgi:hypothetical protein
MLTTHIKQSDICVTEVLFKSIVQEYFILVILRLEEGHPGASLLEDGQVGASTQGIFVLVRTKKQKLT